MEDKSQQYVVKLSESGVRPSSDPNLHEEDSELSMTRSRSSQREIINIQMIMNKREVGRLIQLKQQLQVVRQRRKIVPIVADPDVVGQFEILRKKKSLLDTKRKIRQRLEEKKKQLSKLKHIYAKSELQFEEKIQVFKEKSALLRVLGSKMQVELTKTKQRFRQVEFNKIIVTGIRKVLLFRLVQLLFNENVRTIFAPVYVGNNEVRDDEAMGNCLGYLVLFMETVATIYDIKLWINFVFRGPRSTIRLSDGITAVLHPKEVRFSEVMRQLSQQLYQLMHDGMNLKVTAIGNFYQQCQQLTREILTSR